MNEVLTKTEIERYFAAEKQAGLLFLLLGLAIVVLAVVLYLVLKTDFWKGAAIPLFVFGLIQTGIGYSIRQKADELRVNNVYAYDMHPVQLKNVELPRMEGVNRNIRLFRWLGVLVFAIGVLIAARCYGDESRRFWLGFGITLAFAGADFFTAESIASIKASEYTVKLRAFDEHTVRPATDIPHP
ncbi:MAG TPA: hypothetical protein VG890_07140 [Puia sp.]|nr:hypothetical protein [Puia sp.]